MMMIGMMCAAVLCLGSTLLLFYSCPLVCFRFCSVFHFLCASPLLLYWHTNITEWVKRRWASAWLVSFTFMVRCKFLNVWADRWVLHGSAYKCHGESQSVSASTSSSYCWSTLVQVRDGNTISSTVFVKSTQKSHFPPRRIILESESVKVSDMICTWVLK